MSQHDYDIVTADANTGPTMRAAINAALQALASCSSGATEPSTTYAYQLWADTTTSKLKMRNAANTGWVTVMLFSGDLEVGTAGGLGVEGGQIDIAGGNAGSNWHIDTDSANSLRFFNGTYTHLHLASTVAAVNHLAISGSSTGNNIDLSAQGSDTDINIALVPKGSGKVLAPNFVATNTTIKIKPSTGTTGISVIQYNDGTSYYHLVTNNNNADGTYNSLRPLSINGSTGLVSMANGLSVTGDALYLTEMGTTASAANVYHGNSGTALLKSTSSIQYKKDVETLENAYADSALNLRPVWYRSKAEADNPAWGYYGLIAEEVAEVDPRLVHYKHKETKQVLVSAEGSPETYKSVPDTDSPLIPDGVQYERLNVLLLSVVQRQQKTIEALEARIAALEIA